MRSFFQAAAALLLLSVPVLGGRAEASVANLSAAKKAYPDAKGISCKTCHQNAVGRGRGDLNAYGAALVQTKLDFKALDEKDSDSDGISNANELRAGSNPGEAAAK